MTREPGPREEGRDGRSEGAAEGSRERVFSLSLSFLSFDPEATVSRSESSSDSDVPYPDSTPPRFFIIFRILLPS